MSEKARITLVEAAEWIAFGTWGLTPTRFQESAFERMEADERRYGSSGVPYLVDGRFDHLFQALELLPNFAADEKGHERWAWQPSTVVADIVRAKVFSGLSPHRLFEEIRHSMAISESRLLARSTAASLLFDQAAVGQLTVFGCAPGKGPAPIPASFFMTSDLSLSLAENLIERRPKTGREVMYEDVKVLTEQIKAAFQAATPLFVEPSDAEIAHEDTSKSAPKRHVVAKWIGESTTRPSYRAVDPWAKANGYSRDATRALVNEIAEELGLASLKAGRKPIERNR